MAELILLFDALLTYEFMQRMFIAGMLASVAGGIIGSYVVVKRLVFISSGISHTAFGGIGMAYYFGFEPMIGAAMAALLTAIVVGLVNIKTKIRADSAIGIMWVIGMAAGVLFIKKTEGYTPDPMSILFGNILLVSREELIIMAVLIVIILGFVMFLYKDLLAMTFDEEFAAITGIHTNLLNLVLLSLTALTIVLMLKIVGVILVIAMLTIPPSLAGLFTNDLKVMMISAVIIGIVLNIGGFMISWQWDLPPGATIVILSGVVFLVVFSSIKIARFVKHKTKDPSSK